MMAAARCVQPQIHRCRPFAARSGPRRCARLGRNCRAMAECTRHTSSALHTLGRLALAFSMMSRALSRSAVSSTTHGRCRCRSGCRGPWRSATQARISPAPPAGDQQIHIAYSGHQSVGRGVGGVLDQADRVVSAAGFLRSPCRSACDDGVALRHASLPQRRMQALPLLMARAAASLVTLGRLS